LFYGFCCIVGVVRFVSDIFTAPQKKLRNPTKNRPLAGRCKMWLGAACSYRHENPTEFKNLSIVCEVILRDCRKASDMLIANNV
jgi:hypothetical protein